MAKTDDGFNQATFMETIKRHLGEPRRETVSLDRFAAVIYGAEPDKGFIDSVREVGVLEPVLCYEWEGMLRLLGGGRRVKAARIAGLTEIKAEIYPESATRTWATLSVMLNERRAPNPVTEFEAIKDLQKSGLTLKQITQVTGMSLGTIKRRLHFANLDEQIYATGLLGTISAGVLESAAKLPKEDQASLAAKLREGDPIRHADIDQVRRVDRVEHVQALPTELFETAKADPLMLIRRAFDAARKAAEQFEQHDLFDFATVNLNNCELAIEEEVRRFEGAKLREREMVVKERLEAEAEGREPRGIHELREAESERRRQQGDPSAPRRLVTAGAGEVDRKPGQRPVKTFEEGDRVRIVRGGNKGKTGDVIKVSVDGVMVQYDEGHGSWTYQPNTLVKI